MTSPSNREIGRRIAALRKQRGWSQSALATLIDPKMDQSVLSRIEAGKRKLGAGELESLARVLGVDAGTLLAGPDREDVGATWADEQRPESLGALPAARSSQSRVAPIALESRWDPDAGLACFSGEGDFATTESAPREGEPSRDDVAARLHSMRAAIQGRAAAIMPSRLADRLEAHDRKSARERADDRDLDRASRPAPPTVHLALPEVVRQVITDDLRLRALAEERPASAASWASVDALGRRRTAGKPSGGPAGRPAAAVSWNEPRDRYARLWRHELGVGVDGPVPDLVPLFEDAGIAEVIVARLDTDEPVCANVSAPGLTDSTARERAEDVSYLFVSAARPVALQRYALVHAFAHLALGHGDVVDRRIEWSRATPLEVEANDFAEEFLAPTAAVARWYDRHADERPSVAVLLDLAAAFGITFWAAFYRSRATGHLGEKPAARLMHELRARQWSLLPEQSYRGGLRDTLSTLSEESPLPPSDAVGVGGVPPRLTRDAATPASTVLRVPSGMRRRTLQALRGGRLSLEQAAAVLRRTPADLAAELERLGLE